jgi:hypothetical protein
LNRFFCGVLQVILQAFDFMVYFLWCFTGGRGGGGRDGGGSGYG